MDLGWHAFGLLYRGRQGRSSQLTFIQASELTIQTDGGLTVFLVPRGEGVETKQIKTSYSTAAGTAYITFDNVKVPAENMLGPEDGGLLVILSNFNVSPLLSKLTRMRVCFD